MSYDGNLVKSTLNNIFFNTVVDIYEELYKKDPKLFEIYQEYINFISNNKGRRPSLAMMKEIVGMARESVRLKLNELVDLGYLTKNTKDNTYDPVHENPKFEIESAKKVGEFIDMLDEKVKEGKLSEELRDQKVKRILGLK